MAEPQDDPAVDAFCVAKQTLTEVTRLALDDVTIYARYMGVPMVDRAYLYTLLEVPEIAVQLVESKTKSKEAFYRVARHIALKPLAVKRGDLHFVAIKVSVQGIERRRVTPFDECRAAPTQIIRRGLKAT